MASATQTVASATQNTTSATQTGGERDPEHENATQYLASATPNGGERHPQYGAERVVPFPGRGQEQV
jgi:hypothetical protein